MRGIPHSQEIYNGREYLFDAEGFPRLIFKVSATEQSISDGRLSDNFGQRPTSPYCSISFGGYKYLGHDKWLSPKAEELRSWAYPGEWKKYIKLCREFIFNNSTEQLTIVCRKDEGTVDNEDNLYVYPRGFYRTINIPFLAKMWLMDPDHTFLWKPGKKDMGVVFYNEIVLTCNLPQYVHNKAVSVGIGRTTRGE